MIPTPTSYRRSLADDGWVLFFYGAEDVLGYVFDEEQDWWGWD